MDLNYDLLAKRNFSPSIKSAEKKLSVATVGRKPQNVALFAIKNLFSLASIN